MPLRDLPPAERPRERLMRLGARVLSDYEVLAVVLGAGVRGEHAVAVAQRLMGRGGLRSIRDRGPLALQREHGVGPARAAQIAAAFEMGRRAEVSALPQRVGEPDGAFCYLRHRFDPRAEELVALFLDRRLGLIGEEWLARGGRGLLQIEVSDILRPALLAGAAALIVAHNHPSGDPTPSAADIAATERLAAGAKTIGVQLVDHLVIGDNSFVSLRLAGHLSH